MCSFAQRRTSTSSASASKRVSAFASRSIQAKNSASRINATFTASAMPPLLSRAGNRSRNAASLITANGGANVPSRFLNPKALMPFLTPTPESSWDSTVVGQRTWRTPR